MVYRKNKLLYKLTTKNPQYSDIAVDGINDFELKINISEEPIVLKDVLKIYQDCDLFGLYNKENILNKEFAHFVILNHVEQIKDRLRNREPKIDLFYGLSIINPNTESGLKVVEVLRKYQYIKDMYDLRLGNVNYLKKESHILRKQLKAVYLAWLQEVAGQKGISLETLLDKVKNTKQYL